MTTWYEVQRYENRINPVAVERFTQASAWVWGTGSSGKKALVCCSRKDFYTTLEDAVDALRSRIQHQLERAKARVEKLEEGLKEFEASVADGSVHAQSAEKGGES